MTDTRTKVGHGLAKALGIKLDYRQPTGPNKLSRGESVFSVASADSYTEEEPSSLDWIQEQVPSGRQVVRYLHNLVPFTKWIHRYNTQWLIGDLVAGITIGAVVVPQSMAYAELAELPPEYGLYSSFMGVLIYWFFATSKDITIGPVAVMSTIVGNVVLTVQETHPELDPAVIASALAVLCGCIITGLGLLRLGWLVDFISLASISAFMTGAAINICVGQVPNLLGLSKDEVNSRDTTYKVVINGLRALPTAGLDAAMGMTALFMLYGIRTFFNYMARKQPHRRRLWFFCNTLRTVFVILLYTLISYLANMNLPSHSDEDVDEYAKFKILGTVPRGFRHARVPVITSEIISTFTSQLPASIIVLVIEHISISKSFGRINNYTIDPSQEFVAIGVTNILGPFLGGYAATGSFSRTAIKSKAGVRTPLAGVITAIVVLLAIYALPAVFFYIPSASLAAVIIHAVGDLITPPNTVYQFWRISPLEVIIFFAGVIVTVFTTIEIGIYTTIGASAALFLYRAFKARGRFLGPVKIHSVIGDHLIEGDETKLSNENNPETDARSLFLPMGAEDGSNPEIRPKHPYPGVFIYRFSEGYNYPNANHYLDYMTDVIFKETQRTNPATYGRPGDRPWNDPGPRKGKERLVDDDRPTLKAVILDFSSVNHVDITSVQHLIDVRNQLDKHAAPDRVQWHFAHINNRWTKRALVSAGFGFATPEGEEISRWKPVFSVAELGGDFSAAAAAEIRENRDLQRRRTIDIENGSSHNNAQPESSSNSEYDNEIQAELAKSDAYRKSNDRTKVAVVHGLNRPFFHIDLSSALQSAIHNIKAGTGRQHLDPEIERAISTSEQGGQQGGKKLDDDDSNEARR